MNGREEVNVHEVEVLALGPDAIFRWIVGDLEGIAQAVRILDAQDERADKAEWAEKIAVAQVALDRLVELAMIPPETVRLAKSKVRSRAFVRIRDRVFESARRPGPRLVDRSPGGA